jgi:outer membrane receptor protein involved in Fe transport
MRVRIENLVLVALLLVPKAGIALEASGDKTNRSSENPKTASDDPSDTAVGMTPANSSHPFPPFVAWDSGKYSIYPLRMPCTMERLLAGHLAGIEMRWSPMGRAGPGGVLQMRGFEERKNQLLLNGRSVKGASHFGGHWFDFTRPPLEHIKHVEVMRGAYDAEVGNTLGGWVNIITEKGSSIPQGVARLSWGTDEFWRDAGNIRLGFRSRAGPLGFSLDAGGRKADALIRNNDQLRWDIGGSVSLDLPCEGTLALTARHVDLERGFAVWNRQSRDPTDPAYSAPIDRDYPAAGRDMVYRMGWFHPGDGSTWRKTLEMLDLTWSQPLGGDFRLFAQVFANIEGRREVLFPGEQHFAPWTPWRLWYVPYLGRQVYRRKMDSDLTWGGNVKVEHPVCESNHLEYGVQFNDSRSGKEKVRFDPGFFSNPPPVAESRNGYTEISMASCFVEDRWKPFQWLELVLGLRFDYWTKANHGLDEPDESPNEWAWRLSPKFRAFVEAVKNFRFWAAAGRAVRFPEVPDYARWREGFAPAERGRLVPEDALQFELGARQKVPHVGGWSVALYWFSVKDYIRAVNADPPPEVRGIYNLDEVTLGGIEVEAELRVWRHLSVFGNCTFQYSMKHGDVLDPHDDLGSSLTEIPNHLASFGVRWLDPLGARGMLVVRYVGRRAEMRAVPWSSPTEYVLVKADGHLVVDIGLMVPIFKKDRTRAWLTFQVNNLFNADYCDDLEFPAPGISFTAGCVVRL